jgi:hypothetical protein
MGSEVGRYKEGGMREDVEMNRCVEVGSVEWGREIRRERKEIDLR